MRDVADKLLLFTRLILFQKCILSESPSLNHTTIEGFLLLELVIESHVTLGQLDLFFGMLAVQTRASTQLMVLIHRKLAWANESILSIEVMLARCANHDPWIVIFEACDGWWI